MKLAMIAVSPGRSAQRRARMLLPVHDELVLEAPDAEVDATSGLLRRVMEGAAHLLRAARRRRRAPGALGSRRIRTA